ncbi:MAG: hypothetical protein OEM67_10310 [Thermoleophilia bacterium]|nr:hypothetical protein [Thermoleophilia bacterium]
MRKALVIIVPLAGAVTIGAIARLRARACYEEGEERPDIWARMEQKMAQMPETFPPRMMFDNITAIREQNTRILELLEQDGDSAATETPKKSAA